MKKILEKEWDFCQSGKVGTMVLSYCHVFAKIFYYQIVIQPSSTSRRCSHQETEFRIKAKNSTENTYNMSV